MLSSDIDDTWGRAYFENLTTNLKVQLILIHLQKQKFNLILPII